MRLQLAAILVSLMLASAQVAVASPPPPAPSLEGEEFLTLTGAVTSASCDADGTSTFSYTASGVATGPYPGTFTETGTVVIGPQTIAIGGFTGLQGYVTGFNAAFTIDSPVGQVTGTKAFLPSALLGACGALLPGIGVGDAREAAAYGRYDAVIRQPHVTTDSGFTTLTVYQIGTPPLFVFREHFLASAGIAPGNSGVFKPGSGCGDTNHIHDAADGCP